MANPLVRRLSLQQLLERDAQNVPAPAALDDEATYSALASHVRAAWGRNKLAKQKIDLKLLDCLRARRGVYSPAALSAMMADDSGGNYVYADLTETKCRAASAWIREIVMPVGEQPWGIDPSPVPDLPFPLKDAVVRQALKAAQQAMIQASQAGDSMSQDDFRDLVQTLGEKLRDDAEKTYVKAAQKRAKRMQQTIADRLVDGGYKEAMDGFVEDFVTYPAAILKGPFYRRHKKLEWDRSGWTPKVSFNPVQSWERVSPFDCYPAPSSRSPQQGDFIERVRFRREELYALKGIPDYKDEQIDSALRDYSGGHLEGWLWTEAERQRLEQETLYMWLSPPGVIDALNYWGSVPGWKLLSWGVTAKDGMPAIEETREYECNILLCGKYVLYAALNPDPLDKRPYHKACYDEIPGAFWGRSIPGLAETSQKMCNAIACALADNLSMASGPMVWVHADRFADGEQTLEIFPWKIWQLKSDPTQGVNPGIGFWQADDRSDHLMAVYEKWEIKADDTTGIPRYTYGNERAGGSADTATGLSMLMNNAAKGLRRAISNIDEHVIAPTINQCFINEMMYNPDESIKGDCVVIPRGAAAILIKESAQQRRIQALTMTGNPIDMGIIGAKGRAELLRETFSLMELPVDSIVPSEEQIEQREAAQQQAMAQQGQQQQAEAQVGAQAAAVEQQTDLQREALITQREEATTRTRAMADIVKAAVTASIKNNESHQLGTFVNAFGAKPKPAPAPAG